MTKYKCTITSGGGTKYDSGVWVKKETPKTISFKLLNEPFWEPNCREFKINKFYSRDSKSGSVKKGGIAFREEDGYGVWMNNGHVLRDWKDGTYTAYPNQWGIPYYFEPVS